jgi:ElaB/YqjD/DUF883 family membrane-anchored ribosome-binding protein
MTEITQERRAPADGKEEQSTTEQAKQKVQETGGEVSQQVGQKTQELRARAGEGIRRQLDGRSTQAGEEVTTTADALRRVGDQLREKGKTGTAQYAERAAQPVERLGRYLTKADGDRLLRDAEQLARRRPWIAVLGGATVGFLVARFIKASGPGDAAARSSAPSAQAALPAAPPPVTQRSEFDVQSGH